MKRLDRFLQLYRIRMVEPYLRDCKTIIDIGCSDGVLFSRLTHLEDSVGLDPEIQVASQIRSNQLLPGYFPDALPDRRTFDAITMLAVLEHIPEQMLESLVQACANRLKHGGRVIITVPSAAVDRILDVLKFFQLIDGMELHQHHGYDVRMTPQLFQSGGFELENWRRFQLGLNNLFVFRKVADQQGHPSSH